MDKIKAKVTLQVPVLFNRPPDRIKKTSRTSPSDEVLIKEAHEKVHRNGNGELIIPGDMLKASIIQASSLLNKKINKKGFWKYLKPLLFVDDVHLGITEPDGIHFKQTPNKVGQLIPNYRPYLNASRSFEVTITIFGDVIPLPDLMECVESAGQLIGFGSWRPKFGQFRVEFLS